MIVGMTKVEFDMEVSMHSIEITMEKVVRISKSFEVPDSVYEEIKRTNRIPDDYFCKMEEMCEDTGEDTEYDYAVYDEDYGKQLIEWS